MTSPSVAFIASTYLLLGSTCQSAPNCEISFEKKQTIQSVLCGQNATETQYRQFGPGCIKRSLERRLEDSAVQIFSFQVCGEAEFAEELRKATVEAMTFMEVLAPCVNEAIDIAAIMDERTKFVEQKGARLTCKPEFQSMLESRKPFFQAQIVLSKDPSLRAKLLSRMEINVDEEGNLSDF